MKRAVTFLILILSILGTFANRGELVYNITRINGQYNLELDLRNIQFDTIMIFAKIKEKYKIIGKIEQIDGEIPVYYSIPLKYRLKDIEIILVNKTELYSKKVYINSKKQRILATNKSHFFYIDLSNILLF